MNLILLFESDYVDTRRVRLYGRRMLHIRKVHRAGPGDRLIVGRLNGNMGTAEVLCLADDHVDMAVALDMPPPAPLPLTLILALPRPKMLRRILQTTASLGVKEIFLINTWRVEKGFWSSEMLAPEKIEKELILGLEQARDTVMPKVHLRRFFKSFVVDELPEMDRRENAFLAHPGAWPACPRQVCGPCVLAMGPEGGFIEREVDAFVAAGFRRVSLGERILRLETAVPFIISRFSS